MWKHMELHFDAPPCPCGSEHLSWNMDRPKSGKLRLIITCDKCNLRLEVGEVKARFVFDVPTKAAEKVAEKPVTEPKVIVAAQEPPKNPLEYVGFGR